MQRAIGEQLWTAIATCALSGVRPTSPAEFTTRWALHWRMKSSALASAALSPRLPSSALSKAAMLDTMALPETKRNAHSVQRGRPEGLPHAALALESHVCGAFGGILPSSSSARSRPPWSIDSTLPSVGAANAAKVSAAATAA